MRRFLYVISSIFIMTTSASASEYCVQQYNDQITKASAELGTLLQRQDQIDTKVAVIIKRTVDIASEMAEAAGKVPPDIDTITKLSAELKTLKRDRVSLENEGFTNQDRVIALKGTIPADLQGRLRGCVEASAPANKLVNLAIQALAIMSTGGASLTLPPKSLYVDMSAVLNGYPTGGSKSVINEARKTALDALGIGGKSNDLGNFIRDPGGAIRRCLGLC